MITYIKVVIFVVMSAQAVAKTLRLGKSDWGSLHKIIQECKEEEEESGTFTLDSHFHAIRTSFVEDRGNERALVCTRENIRLVYENGESRLGYQKKEPSPSQKAKRGRKLKRQAVRRRKEAIQDAEERKKQEAAEHVADLVKTASDLLSKFNHLNASALARDKTDDEARECLQSICTLRKLMTKVYMSGGVALTDAWASLDALNIGVRKKYPFLSGVPASIPIPKEVADFRPSYGVDATKKNALSSEESVKLSAAAKKRGRANSEPLIYPRQGLHKKLRAFKDELHKTVKILLPQLNPDVDPESCEQVLKVGDTLCNSILGLSNGEQTTC
jgi:uncharacterized FlaG/YvyC family protein